LSALPRLANCIILRSVIALAGLLMLSRVLSAGSLCFEAEYANELSYPFEIAEFDGASNGLAICVDEGAGSECAFERGRSGSAVYRLQLADGGSCYVWLRVYFNSLCSNSVYVQVGTGRQTGVMSDVLRRWHWTRCGPLALKAGENLLTIGNREDGIAIDQVLLTSADTRLEPKPLTPDTIPGWGRREPIEPRVFVSSVPTGMAEPAPPDSTISHSRLQMVPLPHEMPLVLRTDAPTPLNLWIRNNAASEAKGLVELTASCPAVLTPTGKIEFHVAAEEPLKNLPFSIEALPTTPRGEHELMVSIRHPNGAIVTQRIRLLRPMQWVVSDALSWPLGSSMSATTAVEDGMLKDVPRATPEVEWHRAPEDATTRFGLLDMRKAVADKLSVVAYAYTQVRSPEAGEFLFDVRHDDAIRVWINGEVVLTSNRTSPSDMSRELAKIKLRQGVNDVLVKLSQRERYWEFGLGILTLDRKPSAVSGVEDVRLPQ
jgi:hypothetical protein